MKNKVTIIYLTLFLALLVFVISIFTECSDNSNGNSYINNSNNYSTDNNYNYGGSGGQSVSTFTNKYGTRTTKCVKTGCNNYIASSGDTNCCVTHSNRCGECRCYIDGDAMYCMDCLTGYFN